MKVYLCGPMTGFPDYNHWAFEQVCAQYPHVTILSPHVEPLGKPYSFYMRQGIKKILEADEIWCLLGATSRGCMYERHVAEALDLHTVHLTASNLVMPPICGRTANHFCYVDKLPCDTDIRAIYVALRESKNTKWVQECVDSYLI